MCSYIAPQGEQSTTSEILALTNLTALGNGVVQKTGTNTFTITTTAGDMTKAVYDPTSVVGDAFDMDNMVEGTNKILSAAERVILGNTSNTNTGDNTVCTSGDATTAETLKTARTIGGVSFNGSVAITVASATGGFTVTGGNLVAPVGRCSTLTIAANDSTTLDKNQADYICDGTADEVQINAAITALGAGGGKITLCAGAFNIAASIAISSSDVIIEGAGIATTITLANSSDVDMISVTGTGTRNVQLKNFCLEGNKANNATSSGITIDTPYSTGDTQHTVKDIWINNVNNDGLKIINDTRVCWLKRVVSYQSGASGFNIGGSDHTFTQLIAEGTVQNGFLLATSNCYLVQCKAFGCSTTGDYAGFHLGGSSFMTFIGCEAQDNQQNGFFTDSSGGGHINLIGCISENNGQAGSGDRYGVRIWDQDNWTIIGGFYGDSGDNKQDVGISIADASTGCVVMGVEVTGNLTTQIEDSSTGANVIKDNIGTTTLIEKTSILMKNTSGGDLAAGDLVTYKAVAAGDEVTITTGQGDDLVFGMSVGAITSNTYGYIQTLGKTTSLKVDGTTDIAVGDFIGTFTTGKIGMKAASGDMAIAIALEAYTTDDSSGVIDALLITPRKI